MLESADLSRLMQTLGLSESTPKPENRLKTLFWPRIRYAEDVDLLGTQGYWVCVILACFTVIVSLSRNSGPASLLDALYYYLAGVGIRRTSRFAAISALVIYSLAVVASVRIAHTGGIASVFFLALLLSNVRATWLAKRFAIEQGLRRLERPATQGAISVFTDVLPRLIWPLGRWLYYGLTALMLIGLTILFRTPTPSPHY